MKALIYPADSTGMRMKHPAWAATMPLALLVVASSPALAVDFSWSGFGTLGYARTNQSYAYERFADRDGTLKRDSILGVQTTAEFDRQWSATLQATVAPSVSDDHGLEPTLTWAFLSYRPNNDLLFRVGKLRMPMYLFSENMSVGASYDVMHLPTEVYSTAPTTDFTGIAVSKTWGAWEGELALEAYYGKTSVEARMTEDANGEKHSDDLRTRSRGLVMSFRQDENVYRVGVQRALISVGGAGGGGSAGLAQVDGSGGAVAVDPSSVWQGGATPGSDAGQADESGDIDTHVFLLGFDQSLGHDFRLIGEYARRKAPDRVIPKNTRGAYLTLLKRIGAWTPYVTVGRLLTDKNARQSASNGSSSGYDDQSSWSLGASYRLAPNQKIKGEWMRVHVGGNSLLVDQPSTPVSDEVINVFSVSYSLAF